MDAEPGEQQKGEEVGDGATGDHLRDVMGATVNPKELTLVEVYSSSRSVHLASKP